MDDLTAFRDRAGTFVESVVPALCAPGLAERRDVVLMVAVSGTLAEASLERR